MDAFDLVKVPLDTARFFVLYNVYGVGCQWSYPSDIEGKEPGSSIGKASKWAMGKLNMSEDTLGKDIGYWLSCCGIPAAAVGEGLYYLLNNKNGR
jgi:hypothetical protein